MTNGHQRVAFVWVDTQHEQRDAPAGRPSHAMSKQNDLRRISNEYAVDRALIRDSSTWTVTSGSARHER